MPVIAPTTVQTLSGSATLTQTTLNGTDSFVYVQGVSRYLVLRNPTAGALSPVIDGNGATSEYVPSIGTVATSGGFAVGSIAAGAVKIVDLHAISAYLKGDIAVTGGTGLVATLLAE